jgi:hypothetical protein
MRSLYLDSALPMPRDGEPRIQCLVLDNLGMIFRLRGRSADALRHVEEALAISREIGRGAGRACWVPGHPSPARGSNGGARLLERRSPITAKWGTGAWRVSSSAILESCIRPRQVGGGESPPRSRTGDLPRAPKPTK